MAHIQPENLRNVQKMCFWQKPLGVNGLMTASHSKIGNFTHTIMILTGIPSDLPYIHTVEPCSTDTCLIGTPLYNKLISYINTENVPSDKL